MTYGDRELAGADTLEALCQRGRGAGYLRALAYPVEAAEVIVNCVHHDTRWDHQVDERGWFYASLILDLGIDVTRVLPDLTTSFRPGDDWDLSIATEVLARCARRGLPGAVSELRRYLRSGRDLVQALELLVELAHSPEADGFVDEVFDAFSTADIEKQLLWEWAHLDEPEWMAVRRRHAALDAIVASVVERGTREEAARVAGAAVPSAAGDDTTAALLAMADTTSHPLGLVRALAPHDTAEDRALLVAAAREGSDAGRSAALRALGLQNDDIVIELAPPLLGTDTPLPLRIAARQAIRKLTSYRARAWARDAVRDPVARWVAVMALCDLATADDVTRLRVLVARAIDEEEIFEQIHLVEALTRLEDHYSFRAIDGIFEKTPHSYLRVSCAQGLAVVDPTFADGRAVECLWDCEEGVRAVGVEHADLTAQVRARLAFMVGDVIEDDRVRTLAADRLTAPN